MRRTLIHGLLFLVTTSVAAECQAQTRCECHSRLGGVVAGTAPAPLGSVVDQIFMQQEINAEASKFVIYMHEFELNESTNDGWRLNAYGEDHVKQIAANLLRGDPFPVIVERSQTSVRPGTTYRYPIHFSDQLDARRRLVVVSALRAMGVVDADQRVIVAPAYAEGLTAGEASRAYTRSVSGNGAFSGGGFGGFGGGFGGFFGGF
jgi:hypothetical protein